MTERLKTYQPPMETVTILHLRDQATGAKKYIKCSAIKKIFVPHYENLTVEKILAWARNNAPEVLEYYLPDLDREILKMPRDCKS